MEMNALGHWQSALHSCQELPDHSLGIATNVADAFQVRGQVESITSCNPCVDADDDAHPDAQLVYTTRPRPLSKVQWDERHILMVRPVQPTTGLQVPR